MVEVFALRKLLNSVLAENSRMAFLENCKKTRKLLHAVGSPLHAMLGVDLEFHRLLLNAAENPLLKKRPDCRLLRAGLAQNPMVRDSATGQITHGLM